MSSQAKESEQKWCEVIKSFKLQLDSEGGDFEPNGLGSIIDKDQVYELNLAFHVDELDAPAYALDHVIENQALDDVELTMTNYGNRQNNGVFVIDGLVFVKIDA